MGVGLAERGVAVGRIVVCSAVRLIVRSDVLQTTDWPSDEESWVSMLIAVGHPSLLSVVYGGTRARDK